MDNQTWIKNIVKKLTSEKGKNYVYLSLFFLFFAIFIFAAIRPSLKTAFTLKQEAVGLKATNEQFEVAINKVVQIQQGLEKMRDELPLFSEAIPQRPNVNKLIEDIENIGSKYSVNITALGVGDVNLKEKGSKEVKSLKVQMNANASFEDIMSFIGDLYDQRRIKLGDNIRIVGNETEASSSSSLQITMEIDGYHL